MSQSPKKEKEIPQLRNFRVVGISRRGRIMTRAGGKPI